MASGSTIVAVNVSDSRSNSFTLSLPEKNINRKSALCKTCQWVAKNFNPAILLMSKWTADQSFYDAVSKMVQIAKCKTKWEMWNNRAWKQKNCTTEAASNSHFGQQGSGSRRTGGKLNGGKKLKLEVAIWAWKWGISSCSFYTRVSVGKYRVHSRHQEQ